MCVCLIASCEYAARYQDSRVRCQAEGTTSKMADANVTAGVENQRCRALFIDALAKAPSENESGPDGHRKAQIKKH